MNRRLSGPPWNHYESTPGAADNPSQKLQSTLLTGEVKHSILLGEPRAGTGWKEDARSSDPGGLPCFMFWPPVASKVTLGRPRPFVEAQSLKLKVNNTGSNHAWASSLLWNFNFGSV